MTGVSEKTVTRITKEGATAARANDVYISKWFASEYFTFLNDKDKPLATTETAITTSNNLYNLYNYITKNYEQLASDSASTTQEVPSDLTSSTQQVPSNASSSTQQVPSNASSSTQQAPINASSSIQQTPSNSASSTQQQHNTSFRNKRRRNNDDTATLAEAVGLLKHSVQYLSKEEDCYISYGTHIAHELKNTTREHLH
ncbi:unnamed protein product [Arctia plantaginis]|uniref:Uncharacterized protein n=1 Tax=Arctia plantaginis TaxID=874455 RepID=A0A8S0ZDA1_ARCPL|nr:unnamed protein product [Arctia plantaginis]